MHTGLQSTTVHASNGILFNHESPIRGETFVTRKITRALSRIALGMQDKLYLGNLSAQRDWGHAKDYIRAMYLILQQDKADDYVIATGISTAIRDFIRLACKEIGLEVEFIGEGKNEKGFLTGIDESVFKHKTGLKNLDSIKTRIINKRNMASDNNGYEVIAVDPTYYRPTEVEQLIGDATKARTVLGWKPKYDLNGLITDMMQSDLQLMKKESYLKQGGYKILNYFE